MARRNKKRSVISEAFRFSGDPKLLFYVFDRTHNEVSLVELRRRTKLAECAIYAKLEWPNCVNNAVKMPHICFQIKKINSSFEIVEISENTHK